MRAPSLWVLCFWALAMFASMWSGMRVLAWADRFPPRYSTLCPEPLCSKECKRD